MRADGRTSTKAAQARTSLRRNVAVMACACPMSGPLGAHFPEEPARSQARLARCTQITIAQEKRCKIRARSEPPRLKNNSQARHRAGTAVTHRPKATRATPIIWKRQGTPVAIDRPRWRSQFEGLTSGLGSGTKPSRLGIFTDERVRASMVASSGTRPLRNKTYPETA